MPLRLDEKKRIAAEVNQIVSGAVTVAVAEYRELSSAKMTELRASARNKKVLLRVVRNTLAKRAIEGTSHSCIESLLVGPVILAFSLSKDDLGAPARLIRDFAKQNEKLVVKGFSVNGKLLGAQDLDVVASLPTRQEALAKLVSVMSAPIAKFVRILAEPYTRVVRTFAAVSDKKSSE